MSIVINSVLFKLIDFSAYNSIFRNEDALLGVSQQTDDLFKQLEAVKDHWQSWLQLESLDTNKLSSWQQWDLHFRASKTFGQEVAKLPRYTPN